MLKSWRSSPVCKTGGYAFGGPNPPMPTIYSTLVQLVERGTDNAMILCSSQRGGVNLFGSVPQLVVELP